MRRHKTYVLILLTVLFAMSGTLAWIYLFDDAPKKAPARARQVLLHDTGINHFVIEHTISKH